MRKLINSDDISEAFAQYRRELEDQFKSFPRDLILEQKLQVVDQLQLRINLLCRNGLRVVEGGKSKGESNGLD